jgi:3-oxocholest-4-en-26-oyl-CoA dehydrogenase alpha subunit
VHFAFDSEDENFRGRVRSFLQENAGAPSDEESPNVALERALAEHGWLTMAWPKEYGGLDATHLQQVIFKEELYRANASFDQLGVNLAGPTIMLHGSDELKKMHLPRIARAEARWCQGFSEPGAGSDLASLQTKAVRDGDEFVVNGQKIWTSSAHQADWVLLLTRTDVDAPKHRGITMFVVDMKTPGITVRPLIQITGKHGFNEVYFEDVRVPASNMVGELNRGWYVATTTLDFERSGIERNLIARKDWERIRNGLSTGVGAETSRLQSGTWRHQLAELFMEIEVGQWIARRIAWLQGQGQVPNYEASMSKAFNSEVGQRVSEFGINVFGLASQLREGRHAALGGVATFRYLDARRLSVGQGTSEIQRNIIATRGLGLPRG